MLPSSKRRRIRIPLPSRPDREQTVIGRLTVLAKLDPYLGDLERMADRLYDDLFKRLVRERTEPRNKRSRPRLAEVG